MRLVAYQPDIPQNLGALMRLSACFGMELHVIEPCGFPFSVKAVRRAAMDYAAEAELIGHDSWERFVADRAPGRLILLTTKAKAPYWRCSFLADDYLILGQESTGAPQHIHETADLRVTIPMPGVGRSLNMAMAAGMVAAEAVRQGFAC